MKRQHGISFQGYTDYSVASPGDDVLRRELLARLANVFCNRVPVIPHDVNHYARSEDGDGGGGPAQPQPNT